MPIFAKLHVYKVRPRKDHRGVDLISDVLPFGSSAPREGVRIASVVSV
jgi:hypothetical protein